MAGLATQLKLEGFDQLNKRLLRLQPRRVTVISQKMLSAGGRVVKKAASRTVGRKTGNLARGIKFRRLRRRFDETAALRVFSTAPHTHLVQLGTKERFHKSGKSTGVMPANSFFAEALDEAEDVAIKKMTDELRKLLGKEFGVTL